MGMFLNRALYTDNQMGKIANVRVTPGGGAGTIRGTYRELYEY